ncbi:MAG: putative holin-like toxin [Oscillospiraceae bacterium]|nr:putative holin-like toxin [Oscillospiraceae bacterium]
MSVYGALMLMIAFAALVLKLLGYIQNQHKK